MGDPWQNTERRLMELLADRAAFGLELRDEQELRQLLRFVPDFDTECMERAAATAHLAFTSIEPMPTAVRAKIRATGARHFGVAPG